MGHSGMPPHLSGTPITTKDCPMATMEPMFWKPLLTGLHLFVSVTFSHLAEGQEATWVPVNNHYHREGACWTLTMTGTELGPLCALLSPQHRPSHG